MFVLFQTKEYRDKGMRMPKAICVASNLEEAFEAFNLWDERVVWDAESSWSASVGDYIMDPLGQMFRIEPQGFKYVNHTDAICADVGV